MPIDILSTQRCHTLLQPGTSHSNGLSPVCKRTCFSSADALSNALPQPRWSHANAVCLAVCVCRDGTHARTHNTSKLSAHQYTIAHIQRIPYLVAAGDFAPKWPVSRVQAHVLLQRRRLVECLATARVVARKRRVLGSVGLQRGLVHKPPVALWVGAREGHGMQPAKTRARVGREGQRSGMSKP